MKTYILHINLILLTLSVHQAFAQCFDDSVIKTTNTFNAVYFLNNNLGYVASTNGIIENTVDGGKTWKQANNLSQSYNALSFVNTTTGYAVGNKGAVAKTTDGTNWTTINTNNSDNYIDVNFKDAFNGYITGSQSVLKTSNGGQSWSNITPSASSGEFLDFSAGHFLNNDTGFVFANYHTFNTCRKPNCQGSYFGRLFKTYDGGNTWSYDSIVTNLTSYTLIYSISFPTNKIGYMVGDAYLYKTTDGGNTWSKTLTPIVWSGKEGTFISVSFTDSHTGVAINNLGDIYKTTDGGNTWLTIIDENYSSYSSLNGISYVDSTIYVVGLPDTILKITPCSEYQTQSTTAVTQPTMDNNITIYPNPSNGNFTISTSQEVNSNLSIFNSTGAVVKNAQLIGTSTTINLGNIPQGIYYMQVSSPNGGSMTSKLIIE